MATASPPSVSVLMDSPKAVITSAVMTKDSGMAVRVIAVVRTLSRNRKSTTTTRMAPSRSASTTLPMAALMKSACSKSVSTLHVTGQRAPQLRQRRVHLSGELQRAGSRAASAPRG